MKFKLETIKTKMSKFAHANFNLLHQMWKISGEIFVERKDLKILSK